MNSKSALVVGATGLIGGHCLKLLLDDDAYSKVSVITRRQLQLKHEKLEQCVIDFDQLEHHASFIKANDVFCCLGSTIKKAGSQENFSKVDFAYPYQIAQIASANGSEQFLIVTSIGANPQSSVFYYRIKGEVENAVSTLPFRGVHIFRPSMLLGKREEFRLRDQVGAIVMRMLSFGMIGRWRKFRVIRASAVAHAMIQVAKRNLSGVNVFESNHIQSIYDEALAEHIIG
jgi:uncharacterized protein YbjT (DUF2867 family)